MKARMQARIKEIAEEIKTLEAKKKQLGAEVVSHHHGTYERTEARHAYIECLDQIHTWEVVERELGHLLDYE